MKKILYLLVFSSCFFSCGSKDPSSKVIQEEKPAEVEIPVVTVKEPKPVLAFTVQVGANKKASSQFAALDGVQVFKEDGLFKYRLGAFESYKEARVYRRKSLRQFPDAFVQAVRGKQSISIQEALK